MGALNLQMTCALGDGGMGQCQDIGQDRGKGVPWEPVPEQLELRVWDEKALVLFQAWLLGSQYLGTCQFLA
jgi:hypothetical protein